MKKRKNDCLQNEVQDAKENHAVGEKKKYERKPSQPYCSTCGGNYFEMFDCVMNRKACIDEQN